MKKITLWCFAICLLAFSWQSKAQFGCGSAIAISDGYTATGITTLGDGSQDWNNNPPNSCLNGIYFNSDVYMYTYTSTNNEEIAMTLISNVANAAAGIYSTCSGVDFNDCLDGSTLSTSPTTISATLLPGQTVYIAVGIYAGGLNFDVTDFSVTTITCPQPSNITVSAITTTSATIDWTAGDSESDWEYVVQPLGTGEPTSSGTPSASNSINLTTLTQGTDYEVYVRADCSVDGVSYWTGPAYFNTELACPEPINIVATAITTTSATIGWTAGNSETQWEYVVQARDTGEPTDSGTATASNSVNVSSLTSGTPYEVYVRGNCNIDGFSFWAGPYNFSTACDVVTQFFQDFESTEGINLPVCWNQVGTTGTVRTVNNASVSSTGSRALHIQSTSDIDRGMVALPTVNNADAGTYQLKMNYKATVTSQIGQTLELGYLANPTDANTFVSISSVVTTSTTRSEFITIPTGMPSGNVTFALRTGDLNKNLLVDDIVWELAPTCPYPSALSVSNITSNSADLEWNESGTATTWDIEWGVSGFTPSGTPTIEDTINNPYTLSGLDSATAYEFYVRSDCGGGDTSDWVGPFEFTTECATYTMPFLEDFTSFLPSCWSEGNNTDIATGPDGVNGNWSQDGFLNNGTSGAARFNFFGGTDQDWLVSPTLDLSSGDNGVSVNVGITAYSGSAAETMEVDDEVQFLISEDNGATWNLIYTWNELNSPSNTGEQVIIDLSSYSSATSKLAFWANEGGSGTKDYNFYVDDFNVDSYSTLSVENVESQELNHLTYFPNPVSNVFTIKAQKPIDSISVYNLLGQEMLRATPKTYSSELNLSQLNVGMYLVKVSIEGVSKNIRIIKR
ncbi:fibronectin type III domain-containing protein [Xanthomarina sp. GH4-25]|uniref:fibronectin type III domain-containing protein n=1 Tax=Xanthomarina sp. GH4-25 TaxID=3349335 RepID=UPI0038782B96